MKWLLLGLAVASAACFAAGWRIDRRAAAPDEAIAAIFPYGLGVLLLVVDVAALLVYALWGLFR